MKRPPKTRDQVFPEYRWTERNVPIPRITFGRVLWWLFRPFGLAVILIVLTVFAPGWWKDDRRSSHREEEN